MELKRHKSYGRIYSAYLSASEGSGAKNTGNKEWKSRSRPSKNYWRTPWDKFGWTICVPHFVRL